MVVFAECYKMNSFNEFKAIFLPVIGFRADGFRGNTMGVAVVWVGYLYGE